jgi:hypothetical protein
LDWTKSAQFAHVDYRVIEAPQWRMLLDQETWPRDIQWIRQQFTSGWRKFVVHDQSGRGVNPAHLDHALGLSPRFYVAHDQKLILSVAGYAGWQANVAPLLFSLVGV